MNIRFFTRRFPPTPIAANTGNRHIFEIPVRTYLPACRLFDFAVQENLIPNYKLSLFMFSAIAAGV